MSDLSHPVIDAWEISKSFGTTRALSDVNLLVEAGRVLALLGPNGAGKTTLVRILTTLLQPDAGWAEVAGLDVVRDASRARTVIGLTGQFAAIDLMLTGRENLEMVGELCHLGRHQTRERAGELLEQFDLADVAARLAKTYSGGMRRRLDLAASLIAKPLVLVLDEPTTGLDPRTRAKVWEVVDRLVSDGTTVLLTTQYLEEADHLAHRIALMDRGRIIAEGTSNDLKSQVGGDVLEVQLQGNVEFDSALAAMAGFSEAGTTDPERRRITFPAPGGITTLRSALDLLDRAGIQVDDIGIRRPSLDDVFLALTGHGVTDQESLPGDKESDQSLSLPRKDPSGSHSNIRLRERMGAVPLDGSASLPTTKDHGSPTFVFRDAWVVTKRNLRRIWRTPRLLLVSSIQPVLFVLMFRYVFGGSIHIPRESYIDYLLPGVFVTATLMGATTAVAMATDISGGMIERFRSLPMARSAVLAGRCVADLMRSTLVVAIVLAVGVILGFRFHNGAPGAIAALVFVLGAGFAFICLYALIGSVVKDPETAQLAGILSMMPFVFASSVFVRVEEMPGWLQIFARNQPVTVTVDTVRALCDGGPVSHYAWQSACWIIAIVVTCGWLAVATYRRA